MLHTYLICSMEPEQYEYENSLGEDYSRNDYGQYSNDADDYESNQLALDEEYDMEEEPDWFFGEDKYDDRDYYEPKNEI